MPSNTPSIRSLAENFVKNYNLDLQPPLERSPFALHDAGHAYSNLPATIYGELLQNVVDHAALDKLYGSGAIQGNPKSYFKEATFFGDNPTGSAFVNYQRMPEQEQFNRIREKWIKEGVDPFMFEPGQSEAWDSHVNRAILSGHKDLNRLFAVSERVFGEGDFSRFQDSGQYDPGQGFMPSVSMRNTRNIAPEDVNTARVRGESYADALLKGYKDAVNQGSYIPEKPKTGGSVHASDLAEAAMTGKLNVDPGWSREGIFPFKDKINALSNPPARLPFGYKDNPSAFQSLFEKAEAARLERASARVAKSIGTGFNTTTDLAGSVPLFDPEFRRAVEQGDVRKAATQVAKEYATGLVAAPVVGAGVGVLQRVAPQAARVATGALGVARTANPIAVVSQLGGDTPQPRAVGTYRGATVYQNPQGALVAAPIGQKPLRLGQATLNNKPTFVPWGSVAGTRVGPRTVGRPWWDVGQFFGR